MSDRADRPRGAELAAVLKLLKLEKRADRIATNCELAAPDVCDFSISIYHAREGVRVNGCEHIINGMEALDHLRAFRDAVHDGLKIYRDAQLKIDRLMLTAECAMAGFKKCPKCKGKGGEKIILPRCPVWQDCERCDGRGMVPVDFAKSAK